MRSCGSGGTRGPIAGVLITRGPPGHGHTRSPRRPQEQEGRCQGDTQNPGAESSGPRNPAGRPGRSPLHSLRGTHCRPPAPAPEPGETETPRSSCPASPTAPWETSARPEPYHGLRGCHPRARVTGEDKRVRARRPPPPQTRLVGFPHQWPLRGLGCCPPTPGAHRGLPGGRMLLEDPRPIRGRFLRGRGLQDMSDLSSRRPETSAGVAKLRQQSPVSGGGRPRAHCGGCRQRRAPSLPAEGRRGKASSGPPLPTPAPARAPPRLFLAPGAGLCWFSVRCFPPDRRPGVGMFTV